MFSVISLTRDSERHPGVSLSVEEETLLGNWLVITLLMLLSCTEAAPLCSARAEVDFGCFAIVTMPLGGWSPQSGR